MELHLTMLEKKRGFNPECMSTASSSGCFSVIQTSQPDSLDWIGLFQAWKMWNCSDSKRREHKFIWCSSLNVSVSSVGVHACFCEAAESRRSAESSVFLETTLLSSCSYERTSEYKLNKNLIRKIEQEDKTLLSLLLFQTPLNRLVNAAVRFIHSGL